MALTESRLRQIINEETRRVLREGSYINGRTLVQMLRDAGEDRHADLVADNLHIRRNMEMPMEIHRQGNGAIALYIGNNVVDVIPEDVAMNAGLEP